MSEITKMPDYSDIPQETSNGAIYRNIDTKEYKRYNAKTKKWETITEEEAANSADKSIGSWTSGVRKEK